MISGKELQLVLLSVMAVLFWSWIAPFDRATWWMEAIPVVIAIPLLGLTHQRFPLTRLSYYLIAIHSIILLVGAHYSYAEVPIGFWLQDMADLSRNHYDRLGHLAQGFVPAIIARELFIRHRVISNSYWRPFLVCCFCLAFSAFYELIEWLAAEISADGSSAFLGSQGDIWDAQWDMLFALIGAIISQLVLNKLHDRQMSTLMST